MKWAILIFTAVSLVTSVGTYFYFFEGTTFEPEDYYKFNDHKPNGFGKTITIFGGNGNIGLNTIEKALENGYRVNVYVRNDTSISIKHKKLYIYFGELNETEKIKKALHHSTAVISALGPKIERQYDDTLVNGFANVLNCIEKEDIRRFISIGCPLISDEKDKFSLSSFVFKAYHSIRYPNYKKQFIQMSDMIKKSTLSWTIVRYTVPTDEQELGMVYVQRDGAVHMRVTVARADIASFLVSMIDDPTYSMSCPVIGK